MQENFANRKSDFTFAENTTIIIEQQEIKKRAGKEIAQESEEKVWYAIRVTFNREMKVKDDLDLRGIDSFIPMKYVMTTRRGRRVKKLVPSIHNLIFFHIEPSLMKEYKANTRLPIRYIMNPATKKPVVVPDKEMQNFIAVAGTYEEQLEYIVPKPGQFTRGDRVRILGGPFEGAEGILKRVKGDSRVVVSVLGLVAIVTTSIHPSLLEKLPKEK